MNILLIVEVAVAFGLLVFVHELGHFLAAKKFGVRVEAFSLGFGPSLRHKWGDTEYRLSLIPLGGYVKMAGEQREEGKTPKPGEFYSLPVWRRVIVFAAGAFMNLAMGVVVFCLAYRVGVPVIPAEAGSVTPGSPAWEAGIEPGDRVIELNGRRKYVEFEDLMMASALAGKGDRIQLVVNRRDRDIPFDIKPRYNAEHGFKVIGVQPPNSLIVGGFEVYYPSGQHPSWLSRLLGLASEGVSPGKAAGLRMGDRIVAVVSEGDDSVRTPVKTLEEVREIILDSEGKPLQLELDRDGRTLTVVAKPEAMGSWLLGFSFHSTTIGDVRPDSWAARAGLQPGDTIVRVDKTPVDRCGALKMAIRSASGEVELFIKRDGQVLAKPLKTPASAINLDDVYFGGGNVIDSLIPGFGMARAGVDPGDRLVGINVRMPLPQDGEMRVTHVVRNIVDVAQEVAQSNGAPMSLVIEHEGSYRTISVMPHRQWVVGLLFRPLEETRRDTSLVGATGAGFHRTGRWIVNFYLTLNRFFTGQVATRLVGGPVGIMRITYESARYGLGKLLYWLGIISINLALLNIMPIPVLDGGHILFALIEKVKGSPVSERIQVAATYVGLALLLSLILYATWNDLWSLAGS